MAIRGRFAKPLDRVSGARVRIPPSPPTHNCNVPIGIYGRTNKPSLRLAREESYGTGITIPMFFGDISLIGKAVV